MPRRKEASAGPFSVPALAKLELRGRGIVLRPVKLSDGKGLLPHVRDKEISRFTGIPHPYRREYMTEFLTRVVKEMKAGRRFVFVIRRYDSEEPLGVIDLMPRYPQWRRLELGYWLGRRFWNQGIMTQAVKLVLQFAFETLKLHRVDVGHFDSNEASRRVIEKCWFRREGVSREGAFAGGRWYNLVDYGLLEQEYRAVIKK
jgi:RimJ/RimL family protein N-acetyltransferase